MCFVELPKKTKLTSIDLELLLLMNQEELPFPMFYSGFKYIVMESSENMIWERKRIWRSMVHKFPLNTIFLTLVPFPLTLTFSEEQRML